MNVVPLRPERQAPGAMRTEWAAWQALGVAEDLLAVVSDPTVEISPRSSMKAIGKTPSMVNGSGFASGIAEWTGHRATKSQIERWAADDRHGICLICRVFRAIDIDVGDPAKADAIADFFDQLFGVKLPRRRRAGSGRLALLVCVRADEVLPKLVIPVDGGVVELLGDRQQLVVAGTHPSGARYEWEGGTPTDVPEITLQQYAQGGDAAVETFSTGEARRQYPSERGADFAADDPVAAHLYALDLVLGESTDGRKLFVTCPKTELHSQDNGLTQTAWMTAGSGGIAAGHISCLHTGHGKITDSMFFEFVGYAEDVTGDFEDLSSAELAVTTPPRPPFLWIDKAGRIPALLHNVMLALGNPSWLGMDVAFDEFLGQAVIAPHGTNKFRPVTDGDMAIMRAELEKRGFKDVNAEKMRSALAALSQRRSVDSATEWLGSLTWDGVPRIDTFMVDVFRCADTPYARAVGRYWWSAHAGRVLAGMTGVQADMMPILVSPEGRGKTTTLQRLVPWPSAYAKIDLGENKDDRSRKMQGTMLAEVEELQGLSGRSGEANKAFITCQVEEWVPKFFEHTKSFARRLVLVGTSNSIDFLDGESGFRRFLPIAVGFADRERAAATMEQLWAEGAVLFRDHGVQFEEAERLARAEHEKFRAEDAWEGCIVQWLLDDGAEPFVRARPHFGSDGSIFVSAIEVAMGALGMEARQVRKPERNRISKILQELGFTPGSKRIGRAGNDGYRVNTSGWRHPGRDKLTHNCQIPADELFNDCRDLA